MRIVEATWERRNIGVDVIEIICSKKDTCLALAAALHDLKSSYSVVKIPSGRFDLLLEAQKNGYLFVETSFELWGDVQKIHLPECYNRFNKYIRMEEASGKILDRILGEIKAGAIFETDRIALDPYFSRELAGRRYYNWTQDVLADNAFMGVLYYKDNPVSFNLSRPVPDRYGVYDGILGGLLREAAGKGLGFLVVHGANEICKMYGGKYSIGRVSSNNAPIFRLHLQFGYELKGMTYVLTKHQ